MVLLWSLAAVLVSDSASAQTTQTLVPAPLTTETVAVTPTPTPAPRESGERPRDRTGPPGRVSYEWLINAVRADDFRETAGKSLANTHNYSSAAAEAAPVSFSVHGIQPSGALSGKVLFLMAGHGWTYSDANQRWFTQRGLNLGMVEDMGNLDQMHIMAHYAWNAGATVVPLRPVDHQLNERILDNTSSQTKFFGNWLGSNSTIHHGTKYDKVPYAYTTATLTESAVARFRPYISEAGDYPVYCWARDGADRVNQCYRVVHAGGVTEVRVDHRRVGKGWVWLGTYYFDRGDLGYVEISNQVCDPYEDTGRSVVIADAIRFGNGYSDVRRPAGISGFPREDEGDCYWIAESLGYTAEPRIYTSSQDSNATVSAPPRTAAFMNRETDGRFYDRLLLSFHSNALAGKSRGAVGLYNLDPDNRPTYQEKLAELLGRQLNEDMVKAPSLKDPKWAPRSRVTYNGITFGELRKDYLQNELAATIIEVAFHDNPDDVKFLLDPASRMDMARSCLRAITRWFNEVSVSGRNVNVLPTPPDGLVVRQVGATTVTVTWKPGPSNEIVGDPPMDYRVYLSRDGRAFDAGHSASTSSLDLVLTGGTILAAGEDLDSSATAAALALQTSGPATLFVRVAARNAGGESWPSETQAFALSTQTLVLASQSTAVGASAPSDAVTTNSTLLVTSPSRLDSSTNFLEQKGLGLGYPTPPFGTNHRVRPRVSMVPQAAIAVADALTTNGISFDSCSSNAVAEGLVQPAAYDRIVWVSGLADSNEDIATTPVQAMLLDHVSAGKDLVLIAPAVGRATNEAKSASPEFLAAAFGVEFSVSGDFKTVRSPSGEIYTITKPVISESATDVLKSADNARPTPLLTYEDGGMAAAINRTRGGIAAIISVPLESLGTAAARREVLRAALGK